MTKEKLHTILVGTAGWAIQTGQTSREELINIADSAMVGVEEYANSKARDARLEVVRRVREDGRQRDQDDYLRGMLEELYAIEQENQPNR